jgi:hypothetical protein
VHEATLSLLSTWANFYVIVGSSAAALTGLMFVVITLIASTSGRKSDRSIAAFGTPNVVHFCAVLLIAALLSAPWQALWPAALLLGLCGLAGIVYVIIVKRRAHLQAEYQPELEDWLCHVILPFVAYTVFLVAAFVLPGNAQPTLFVIGAAMILLLFIGIHNAWDTVTYIVIQNSQPEDESREGK